MRFERVRLRNFKPYEDADLTLDRGVSVVLGPNGSGKSSLLQACFFALYGSKALEDVTLGDLVTQGAEESEIELWFAHEADSYHVRRRIRATGERARTAECVMETPTGTVEGATSVRGRVVEMVRMDAEAFVNCAYVRQGEVNKLIHATPGERQDMIDDLLQLGKLETYRERAGEARLGVNDLLEGQREVADNLDEQIATKEAKDLHARLDDLEDERTEVEAEIERFEGNREDAREARDQAREVLERHEAAREDLAALEEQIDELRDTVTETERERGELADDLADAREARDEHREERERLLADFDPGAAVPDENLLAPVATENDGESVDVPDVDASALALDADADPGAVGDSVATLNRVADALDDRQAEVAVRREELTGERDRHRERADELESEASEKRETADDLADDIADERETLDEREQRLADVDEEITALEDRFADAPTTPDEADDHLETVREEREQTSEALADLRADRQTVADRIEEAEALLAAGKCPECGQSVEDSPHVDRLDDDRAEREEIEAAIDEREADLAALDDRVETAADLTDAARELDRLRETRGDVERLIADKRESIEDDQTRVEKLRETAADLAAEAEDEREAASEVDGRLTAVEERAEALSTALSRVETALERLERVVELDEAVADAEDRVASLSEERERLAELNDERRQRLADLRERRDDIEEDLAGTSVEEARDELQRAAEYLENVETKLDDLREQRDDLKERIGGVNAELRQLEELHEQRETVQRELSALESLHEETEKLEATYGDLRADLRQRNVEVLERMLNDTFDLVYGGDSYAGIELGDDYSLTVTQKDGETLDPEQLSGGERALFNLSLRTAIYRLLAEGVEGTAPLPPLILDEPTVFLDSEHVSRLIDLVEEMRELGVEQIVVVTHDEELLGAADGVIRVRKDPTTNRSSVERAEGVVGAPPAE